MEDEQMLTKIKNYTSIYKDDMKRLDAIYDIILENRPDLLKHFSNCNGYEKWKVEKNKSNTLIKEKNKLS